MKRRLFEWMSAWDGSEERRYLREGGRLNIAWGWLWLSWSLGVGADYQPFADERWAGWLMLGPLSIECYWVTDG